jgi:23S rRNA pseudouridine2605 synthase
MPHPKLAKFLAHAGVASRRAAEELIAKGKILVNQEVETNVARRVDPQTDKVEVQGQGPIGAPAKTILFSLYKPVGVVSTTSDPDGKPTIMKYIPEEFQNERLYPVGRLDEESEGLLLITNDGDLAYKLTHPKFQVPRTYRVWIDGAVNSNELYRLRTGIPLKDGRTAACEVNVLEEQESRQLLEITLNEGRHHQIRRMMQAVNHPVVRLKRISHGKYRLGDLQPGKIRQER